MNRTETLTKRKDKAKNDIILRALSEFSDLEALRAEKRAIMEEEQRYAAIFVPITVIALFKIIIFTFVYTFVSFD